MAEEKQNMPTVNDQYQRLINARNFHYENLNKWLITFYAIIGALFLAFYTLYSKKAETEVEIIVAIVGYIVSIAALLSIKGYFYWEYNWIEKLYRFEKNVMGFKGDEQVYSSIINKEKHDIPCCPINSANVSTTKVALFVTFGVAVAWGFILGMFYFKMNFTAGTILISLGVSAFATCVLLLSGALWLHSDLGGLDELPDTKDMHKTYHAKAICLTIFVLIAIATSFLTLGYRNGKNISNPADEITTLDSISLVVSEPESIQKQEVEIIVKQNTCTNSNTDAWYGILGSLFGAVFGAFVGWRLTTLSDKDKENKRKEQNVKEIQLLTNAVLKHTTDCNQAIRTYCDNIQKKPYEICQLQQGILASIERLSRLDATLVFESFKHKGKEEQFYRFLNLIDQLLTLYSGIYSNYERHNRDIIKFINEFIDLRASIIHYLQEPNLVSNLKDILTQYEKSYKEMDSSKDLMFDFECLITPAYWKSSQVLPPDTELFGKADRATYVYNSLCGQQRGFVIILQRNLLQIQETIKLIEEIQL